MKKTGISKKTKNDILLTASILIVAVAVFFATSLFSRGGSYAEVKKDGKVIAIYPLDTYNEIMLEDENGYNLLMIDSGAAYIKDASCPDRLCMHQGKVNKNGQTLVCLPNKITVTIVSEHESDTDFIT